MTNFIARIVREGELFIPEVRVDREGSNFRALTRDNGSSVYCRSEEEGRNYIENNISNVSFES